jgi:hypothetical protein
MNFSIVLASRERVDLLANFFDSIAKNTHDISGVEVLVGIDHCDEVTCAVEAGFTEKYPFVKFYRRERSSYLNRDYLNWLTGFSTGKFIIACNDDVDIRTKNWDKTALDVLSQYLADKPDGIVYGNIEDGLKDRYGMEYCCFPLFSRAAYNVLGWLLPGVFLSWNADIAAWRVYQAVNRVCRIPIMFNHVSYHTGQRERDEVSHRMEKLSMEAGVNGCQYDITEDVDKLNACIYKGAVSLPEGKCGIIFSFVVPSRERPEQLETFLDSLERSTINKKSVEVCIAYDSDDKKTVSAIGALNRKFGSLVRFYGKTRSNMLNRDYVNWLMKFTNGSFVIPVHDDCKITEYGWDEKCLKKIKSYLSNKPDLLMYGLTEDGSNRDLSSFPVLSKAGCGDLGYIYHPDFPSLGGDVHLGRLYSGISRVLDLRECLKFEHNQVRDGVSMCVERQAARVSRDSTAMDITGESMMLRKKIADKSHLVEDVVVVDQPKPKLLFVTEKWCDGNEKAGVTNSVHNLFGSLEVSKVADFTTLHFDEYFVQNGKNCDVELLRLCEADRPDAIISSYLCHPAHLNVAPETWAKIKAMGIPVIFIWFDLIVPFVTKVADSLSDLCSLNVVLDTSKAEVSNKDKFMPMWTPQDTRQYFNSHTPRNIDVCFLGSVNGYRDRIIGLEALKYNAIDVVQLGGQRDNPIPLETYVDILQRSKICLNFAQHRCGPFVQAKGRIFEATLCGALLMDSDNDQTKNWFTPDEHYISFKDETDLVHKVKHHLKNDGERGRIANAGWLKSSILYSPRNFWKQVLERVGL